MSKMTDEIAANLAMNLIVSSGDARSSAFEALKAAREGAFDRARELMQQSDEALVQAHHVQTDLLCAEANGEGPEVGLLMVHAQDHLMTSMLARDLIEELMEFYAPHEG